MRKSLYGLAAWRARTRGVDLVGLKPDPYDPVFLQCFETVGGII